MLEYMSVREAAGSWGLSERRVHKLCKDGRVAGVIRFGRSWGIPGGTEKPGDARKGGGGRAVRGGRGGADNGTPHGWLGSDAKLLARSETCEVFQLENETGNGIVTSYDVFEGVQLLYSDLHMSRITGHDEVAAAPGADMLVVNHCREGRFECEFRDGECGYMGGGDMVVTPMPVFLKTSSFPLAHYHGISIMIDIPRASETLEKIFDLLGTPCVDIRAIKDRLLEKHQYFLVRSSDAVEHIFSELYNAPDELKESYIRLKLVELLLFLSVAETRDAGSRRYFYKTRVNAVKAMRDYMTANLDKQFTLGELSERFNIPLTAMKSCFKSVFGAPINAYMREYRIQTAAAMLRESDASIAEIAAKVGCESHARFTAAFKAATGTTPSDFRKISVQNGAKPSS
jgi:AraC-like DNA-binding protein